MKQHVLFIVNAYFLKDAECSCSTTFKLKPSLVLMHGRMFFPKLAIDGQPVSRVLLDKARNVYELYHEMDMQTLYKTTLPGEKVDCQVFELKRLSR